MQSRKEDILRATIDGTEYDKPPLSREEKLLIELKETIEAGGGGGGGGTTDYNQLSNKPQIAGTELKDNKSFIDLGISPLRGLGSIETTDTAQYSHNTNTFFINKNGEWVRATTNIAIGDTIEINTNCRIDDLGMRLGNLETRTTPYIYINFQNATFKETIASRLSQGIHMFSQSSTYTPTDLPSGETANQWTLMGLCMKYDANSFFAIVLYTHSKHSWIVTGSGWFPLT